MTQILRVYDLVGKDYFDQWEAAHYMCMSVSKFKQLVPTTSIKPLNNHGKTVYRKTELEQFIEKQNE